MTDLHVNLGGLVVGPDEVLVVVLPEEATPMLGDELRKALDAIGLVGRSVVIRGDVKLATVPRGG